MMPELTTVAPAPGPPPKKAPNELPLINPLLLTLPQKRLTPVPLFVLEARMVPEFTTVAMVSNPPAEIPPPPAINPKLMATQPEWIPGVPKPKTTAKENALTVPYFTTVPVLPVV